MHWFQNKSQRSSLSLARLIPTVALICVATFSGNALAETPPNRENFDEPIYRVTDAGKKDRTTSSTVVAIAAPQPPATLAAVASVPVADPRDPKLIAAVNDANVMLQHIRSTVKDYECVLVRKEKVRGKVLAQEYIKAKIRHRQQDNAGNVTTPFTVYLKYLKPAACKGRQVIFDEHVNNKQLFVKEGGLRGRFVPAMYINLDSPLVMKGSRHPVTDIGIENLTIKLLERSTANDGNVGGVDYTVKYENEGWNLNGIECKYLCVEFLTQIPRNESSKIEIFIDKKRNIPIRYAAYDWPTVKGGTPDILEEYTYLNVKLNSGLADKDFNPANYPGFIK